MREMKTITFKADAQVIESARARARAENTTLSAQFRAWLSAYACPRDTEAAMAVIDKIATYVNTGGSKLTRDDANKR